MYHTYYGRMAIPPPQPGKEFAYMLLDEHIKNLLDKRFVLFEKELKIVTKEVDKKYKISISNLENEQRILKEEIKALKETRVTNKKNNFDTKKEDCQGKL